MRIRPLTRQDLSIVADIHAAAFWDDQISIWLYPHKEQYPNDFRDFWFRWMQFAYCQPGFRIWVVEDEETGAVLGSALWERRGKTEVARSWRKDTVGNCTSGLPPSRGRAAASCVGFITDRSARDRASAPQSPGTVHPPVWDRSIRLRAECQTLS